SAAPHWGFVDETSSVRTRHSGAEVQLLADRELKRDQLVGALNVLFANDRARLLASDGVQQESLVGAGAALAAQIMPAVWLGGEARYLRDYGGAGADIFSSHGAPIWATSFPPAASQPAV